MNDFARWFKARRLELKLDQWDVAERMGRSRGTISLIECGNVPRQKLKQKLIAEALEVSLEDVASRAAAVPFHHNPPNRSGMKGNGLIADCSNLSEREQRNH